MIVVPVAEHEGVEVAGLHAQQFQIVVECLRREPEIHQRPAGFLSTPRSGVHGKAKLADHRRTWGMIRADAPTEMLNEETLRLAGLRPDGELVAVRDDPNCDLIEFWDRLGESLGSCRAGAAAQACATQTSGAGV